jgi:hypothetical protein
MKGFKEGISLSRKKMRVLIAFLSVAINVCYALSNNRYSHVDLKEVMLGSSPVVKIQLVDVQNGKVGAYLYSSPSSSAVKVGRIFYDFNNAGYYKDFKPTQQLH